METIRIKSIVMNEWEDEKAIKRYYTGEVEELNGSGIIRYVGFVFRLEIGDCISANDANNPVLCVFLDHNLKITDLKEGQEVEVDFHKTRPHKEGVCCVTLLEEMK